MKKRCIAGILFIISVTAFAQVKPDDLPTEIIIGRNFKNNSDIKAKEYVFSDNIDSWHCDDSTQIFTMQLRGKNTESDNLKDTGELLSFDLPHNRILWQKELNYLNSTIDHYHDMLINTTDNQSSRISNEDGQHLWTTNNSFCYVNPSLKIGIGISYDDSNSARIEGIDMVTGKMIWERGINMDYGVNDISQLNDSVIIIVASGIHFVNLKNGEVWNYYLQTGKKNYSVAILKTVISAGFSMLSDTEPEVYTDYTLFTDMASNVLVDSSSIYVADRSSIVRLDLDGNEIWKKELPTNMTRKSSLFMKESSLYMINYGYAFKEGEPVISGRPFIAAFDKNTGKQLYSQTIGYKNEKLDTYCVKQDTVILLSKNRIFEYALKLKPEIWELEFNTDSVGELTQFAGRDMYFQKGSTYTNLYLSDTTKVYVYTNKDNLIILNSKLSLQKIIPVHDLFYCYLETNGYKFLENGNLTVVIDQNGLEVAELNISSNVVKRDNRLFEVEGNSLVEINIDQLTN